MSVAANYFCRLEYASIGFFRSSMLSDVAKMAQQYVKDVELRKRHDPNGSFDFAKDRDAIIPFDSSLALDEDNDFEPQPSHAPIGDAMGPPLYDGNFAGFDLLGFFDYNMLELSTVNEYSSFLH
ncbi:hypothetical protein PVAG01_02270 [Phlyctema vagabunda]|uniref:Uncharacterized protein n=1 Tax=Phlyctema vagabunda TaxID=108571 RepID=A0ABR4PQ61_9HELO